MAENADKLTYKVIPLNKERSSFEIEATDFDAKEKTQTYDFFDGDVLIASVPMQHVLCVVEVDKYKK